MARYSAENGTWDIGDDRKVIGTEPDDPEAGVYDSIYYQDVDGNIFEDWEQEMPSAYEEPYSKVEFASRPTFEDSTLTPLPPTSMIQ